MNDLTVGSIVSKGVSNGMKNVGSIAVNAILWVLTIWIPYINVGTTIGLAVGLAAKSGRGEPISPTEIFNPVYRKRMGDYFLVTALVMLGTYIGFIFVIFPGFVLAMAWLIAPLLVVDKGISPLTAMTTSNNLTYGKKWTIFFGYLVLSIIMAVVVGVLALIGNAIDPVLAVILGIIGMALSVSFVICGQGFIYQSLAADVAESA